MSNAEKSKLSPYFSQPDLDRIRVVIADPLPIAAPPLAAAVRTLGFDFPSVAFTAAIVFDDVIAAREQMTPSLLFHEAVHTVQYRVLGVADFARLYVRGFLAARSYHAIPIECCAFDLGGRFELGCDPFSVEAEILKWVTQRRF